MAQVLWAAAIYNLAWGGFVVLYPELPFRWAGMPPPNYPEIWQCLGMVVSAGSLQPAGGRVESLAAGSACPLPPAT